MDLDFFSLYPSLIITYNLSPEKLILSYEKANNIRERRMNYMRLNFYLIVIFFMSSPSIMIITLPAQKFRTIS